MTVRWRPNRSVTFNKWKDCDICGLSWPEKEIQKQYGTLRCPECMDQPGHIDTLKKEQKDLVDVRPPWDPEETT
jgi:ribosomal protein L34E